MDVAKGVSSDAIERNMSGECLEVRTDFVFDYYSLDLGFVSGFLRVHL